MAACGLQSPQHTAFLVLHSTNAVARSECPPTKGPVQSSHGTEANFRRSRESKGSQIFTDRCGTMLDLFAKEVPEIRTYGTLLKSRSYPLPFHFLFGQLYNRVLFSRKVRLLRNESNHTVF